MKDDIWLKRWNTLKNYINAQIGDPDLDDPVHATITELAGIMDRIELLKDEE